jgi:hypothetical protein
MGILKYVFPRGFLTDLFSGVFTVISTVVFVGVFAMCSLTFTSKVQASDFYTDAGLTANIIKVHETTYRPVTARAKLGYIIAPQYSIETHIATNVYKDEKEAQQYKVRNVTSLFLRYGTPAHRKFRAFMAAGYSYATLDITNASGNFYEDHKGFSYAFGFEENLDTFKNISFTLEYAGYIDDNSAKFSLSGISAGFRAPLF